MHGERDDLPGGLGAAEADRLSRLMGALASPTRLRILSRLEQAPCGVGALVDEFDLPQSTVSNHLRILRHLDLVTAERVGRQVTYSVSDQHVREFLRQALLHLLH